MSIPNDAHTSQPSHDLRTGSSQDSPFLQSLRTTIVHATVAEVRQLAIAIKTMLHSPVFIPNSNCSAQDLIDAILMVQQQFNRSAAPKHPLV
jgi:hypothetical protein